MENIYYSTSAEAHLERAKARLTEETKESLFYSAFELRCGVEARFREYLEFQDHVSRSKREEWSLNKLSKTVEETFCLGNQVAKFTIYDAEFKSVIKVLYYTPVTSELRNKAERLGYYLHSLRNQETEEAGWWDKFRRELDDIVEGLSQALAGTLLGAPLLDTNGRLCMPMGLRSDDSLLEKVKKGTVVNFNVEYLTDYPQELLAVKI